MKFNRILQIAFMALLLQSNAIFSNGTIETLSHVGQVIWSFGEKVVTNNKSIEKCEEITATLKDQVAQQAATNAATQANLTEIGKGVAELKDNVANVSDQVGVLQILGGAAAAVVVVKGAYDLGCFIKSHISPSDEEKLREEEVDQRLCYLIAYKQLKKCLVLHEQSKKDEQGMPHACAHSIQEFKQAAGYSEFEKVRSDFKKATQAYAA